VSRALGGTLALAALLPQTALGWGADGHRTVAAIAEERLSPRARTMVRELVDDVPLSDPDVATWADALRDPRTRPWHYVNIPFSARYDATRDCVRGCAAETLERATAELVGNGSAMRRTPCAGSCTWSAICTSHCTRAMVGIAVGMLWPPYRPAPPADQPASRLGH
jgi:hypothetical protein